MLKYRQSMLSTSAVILALNNPDIHFHDDSGIPQKRPGMVSIECVIFHIIFPQEDASQTSLPLIARIIDGIYWQFSF